MAFTEQDLVGRKYILFDFDGTLADTKPAIVDTARKVLLGWGLTDEQIGDAGCLVGPPFPDSFVINYGKYGVTAEDAVEITRRYREIYFNLGPETFPLFSGMKEMLESLKSNGYHLAIASSKITTIVDIMLKGQGIFDLFEVISANPPENQHATKSDVIRWALERFGVDGSEAIMVGDLHHDVDGATVNGVPCVGVYFGGTAKPGELEAAGAAACAHSVEELHNLLTK